MRSRSGLNKPHQSVGLYSEILLIENTFRQAQEESRHSILQHASARAEQRRPGHQCIACGNQVGFVSTSAMK